jgi:hypothetical protein
MGKAPESKGANGIDSYCLCKTRQTNETVKTVRVNCKECKFSANSNVSQLIRIRIYPIFRRLKSLGRGIKMSRQQPQLPVSSPRLLASAIGMAITAGSAGHMVFAAEKTDEKAPSNTISSVQPLSPAKRKTRPPTRSKKPPRPSTPRRWWTHRARSP